MNRPAFQEALLKIMEKKRHWAWPAFSTGKVKKERLHIHFEQEYETYVRDFPVFLGRAFAQCPVVEVRRELAENIYEEETGGLSGGRPHPELFLEYPKGLGFDLNRYQSIKLLPGAKIYRDFIDDATMHCGWEVAAAISTLFIEGTSYERGEIQEGAPKRPQPPLEEHPLVLHYELPLEALALTKVHRAIEGDHRGAAWRILLEHMAPDSYLAVQDALHKALEHWLAYRDDVAIACELSHGEI